MNKTKITIAILALSSMLMAFVTISSVLQGAAEAFPEASTVTVQSLFTIIAGVAMVCTLLVGKLASFFTKKQLSIMGTAALFVGGMIPLLFHTSIGIMMVGSILIGVGTGVITPISSALIAEYFQGESRVRMMGFQSLAVNGGATLLNLLAGYLVSVYWAFDYFIFLLCIPLIVLLMILLPKGTVEKAEKGEHVKLFTPTVLRLCISTVFMGMFFSTLTTNVGFYLAELGLNDAASGVAVSCMTIGSVLAGLILGFIAKALKQYTMVISIAVMCIGMFCLYWSQSIVLICISAVCVGFGFGAYVPTGFARIPSLVSPAAATMAISIFAAGNSFGQFLNPYVVTSSATLINDSVGARFLISAVCLGIVFVINMIFEYKEAKQTPTATETES